MATRKARSLKKNARKSMNPGTSMKNSSFKMDPQLQWDAYKALEHQIDAAWLKLEHDVKRRASPQVLLEDQNHLVLLLGECSYMAHEWMRWTGYSSKKRK